MSKRFQDRVVVVTGGNSGIGLATARAFRAEGAKVVVTGRDEATREAVQRELAGDGLALRSDASSSEDAEALVRQVRGHFGRIDVLFVDGGMSRV